MLSSTQKQNAANQSIKEDCYLNFNHRPQRVIIYNLMMFLWSMSNILFYCDMLSDKPIVTPMYEKSTNKLLLVYNLMISIASFIVLFLFYFQLKIKDLSAVNISFTLATNRVELPMIDGIHLFIGLIYFLSFLLHIAITWKMCENVCGDMNKPFGCNITIISSTLLAIVFPAMLCADIIDSFFRNPNKRILFCTLVIFLASFSYIWEFQSNDFGEDTYYLSSYIRFAQTSFYLISAATASIYICEGFYHEGILKKYFEIIVSFILLCSPIVAYGTHVIQFNGITASYETWFIIVVLSVFMSYDLQKLQSFNINVIGAQASVRERFITQPPTVIPINTPSVYKQKKIYKAPSAKGNINGPDDGDHLMYGSNDDFDDTEYDSEKDESFSYLVFKKFSFKLDDKKQRLILFNTLLLIYSVGHFIYFFNFWVNYNKASFKNMKAHRTPQDFAVFLKKSTYKWYCTSFVFMIIISAGVIFMEWFVVGKNNRNNNKFYKYSCALLYVCCGILQIICVVLGTNDYCKHLSRAIENNGNNYYCHMQYVSSQLISIMLPLFILSIDIIGLTKLFFDSTRIRVEVLHLMITLSCVLFYIGYYNYYTDLDTYATTKLLGLLMIAFSFIFSTFLSPLFLYLESNAFSNFANLISTVLIVVGTAFVLDVNNLYVNIAEWTLFVPICCLVAYEIQLL